VNELDVPEPPDGTYELTVTGTATGTYNLLIRATDFAGNDQGRLEFEGIPTAPGVLHRYTFNYSAAPGTRSTSWAASMAQDNDPPM
jgi:hypothetical protein